jgi:hypothetical protein
MEPTLLALAKACARNYDEINVEEIRLATVALSIEVLAAISESGRPGPKFDLN